MDGYSAGPPLLPACHVLAPGLAAIETTELMPGEPAEAQEELEPAPARSPEGAKCGNGALCDAAGDR